MNIEARRVEGRFPLQIDDAEEDIGNEESQGLLPDDRGTHRSMGHSSIRGGHVANQDGKYRLWSMGKFPKYILLLLVCSYLMYQIFSDQIYLWMMTTEITSMLLPASRRYCTHESLWVPFNSKVNHTSDVAVLAVLERRPDGGEETEKASTTTTTPSFKRLTSKLMSDSLKQQEAYAQFWDYDHVVWEGREKKNAAQLGDRPIAWGKLLALKEALETHEYVLYLDLDLAVIQPMLRLDGFIEVLQRTGKEVLLSEDGNGVNTGVMLFRRSPWSQWFLDELWRVGEQLVACDCIFYYEQRVFHHALQTPQWRKGYKWWTHYLPVIGWFRNSLRGHPPGPSLAALPLLYENGTVVKSAEEVWSHVELVPGCALNAIDSYTDAEFIVHFAGQKGQRKEKLMEHFSKIAQERLEDVARPLRQGQWVASLRGEGEDSEEEEEEEDTTAGSDAGAVSSSSSSLLPVVYQTWKTHDLEAHKKSWHMSWLRNGFQVVLKNDTECLQDIHRLVDVTHHPAFLETYRSLNPVQRADFWRYAVVYLEGGIYSDIDIGATPETAKFFLQHYHPSRTKLVGIIENAMYNNIWGHFHWKVGMSPMYSRVPQLRQSFFYACRGHPQLLKLMLDIDEMVEHWTESGHTDIGKPAFSTARLKDMERSGALTLEMTGPGVWTDYLLTPLLSSFRGIQEEDVGRTDLTDSNENGDDEVEEILINVSKLSLKRKIKKVSVAEAGEGLPKESILIDTMEGYSIIRYGSMGSWKTEQHKADFAMWRNILIFYSSPLLLVSIWWCCRKYLKKKKSEEDSDKIA